MVVLVSQPLPQHTSKKGALIAQYIGRFLVLTKDETDLLFHPMFFQNHERLIELGPIMQPIVYEKHASALHYSDVSSVLVCAHIISTKISLWYFFLHNM